jgi:transposase-like protein
VTIQARELRRRRRAERAIRALGEQGNPKKAAADLGVAESTLRKWVAEYLELNGYESTFQALYRLNPEVRISA